MEKTIQNIEELAFAEPGKRYDQAARVDQLFVRAVGDELVDKREESIKHFDLGSNRYQAVVYSEPVHYRENDNDSWKDIDNTLEVTVNAQGRNILRNRANRIRAEFPLQMDGGNMASVTEKGRTFAWRFERETQPVQAKARTGAELKQERLVKQAQQMPKFVGRTIESLQAADLSAEIETEQARRGEIVTLKSEAAYENVLPGVSVRYTMQSESVKEDIILENASALAHAAIRLPKDFEYQVTEARKLQVLDKASGEAVFIMETPRVYDAAGNETIADIALTDCGSYVRMEYVLEDAFLTGAQYPVTIDPIVHSSNPTQNIQDTTLGQGQSAKPYTEDHLKIGKYNGSVRCVALFQFNKLAIPSASDTIISAVLQMAPKNAPSSNYIGAYEIKKPWTAANVNWASFNPDSTANVGTDALECVAGSTTNWLAFDLTNLYRKWCTRNEAGVSNNNGVAFRTPDNVTGNNYSELYSSDAASSYKPVMYVNYVSHAGLEGWWQYEEMSAGRAGTVHADLFNGNMVLEHSDTAMTGNRNPISVNHYYNSCLSSANNYNCGYGWKTDAHQKVTLRKHNNKSYFVWEDGDGTEHFFEWTGSQPYKDAEGMDLELTYSSSGGYIIISDREHNQMRFEVIEDGLAWLSYTRDACDNRAAYTYVKGYEKAGRLDKITDPVGRVTQFSYNSDGLISCIRIPDAEEGAYRDVTYTYDSSKRLTGVHYSELNGSAPHTTYGYNGSTNLLTKARNYDGVQVNIGYEALSLYDTDATDQARRVLSLETVATNSSGSVTKYGAKQLFEYKHMCTEVTAVENTASDAGKKLHYQFNDAGNVVCVRDDLGFARFTKFESGIENKPSSESPLRKAVINLLRSPDLSENWTAAGSAAKDTGTTCMSAPSVKITGNGGESTYRQQVTLKAGTMYTFSCYVKTSSIVGGEGAFLRLSEASGGNFNCSRPIFGSTESALGNEMPTDGWERLHVSMQNLSSQDASFYAEMVVNSTSGTAWFSCPQVEEGLVVNPVNLVSNGDFRYTYTSGAQTLAREWTQGGSNLTTANTGVHLASTDAEFPEALSGNYIQVEGRPSLANVGYVQQFDLKGSKGDVFVVGGWANAKSVPKADKITRGFAIAMRLKKKSDGKWIDYYMLPFNSEWVGWQFGSWALVAGYDYTAIDMTLVYTRNCGLAKFSNVFMYREQFGQSFAYDDDHNVVSTTVLSGQKSDIKYDSAHNVQRYTQPGRTKDVEDNQYWFYYGGTDTERNKHLLLRSRTPMHVTDYFSYDKYGNQTSSRRVDYRVYTGNTAENKYPYTRSETAYTDDGNYTASTKDARGNTVTQATNPNDGTLTSVTDPTGQTVEYTYDASKRVTEVQTADGGKTYKNAYTYEDDRIKTVSHNTTGDAADVTYTFGYDALGRKTTVKVGSQTLSTNVYDNARSGLLSEVKYGNGSKVTYRYDEFDRMIGMSYDGEEEGIPNYSRFTYTYGANGLASVVNDDRGMQYQTTYDLSDRPCETQTIDAENQELYRTRLKYDKLGNLESFAETVKGSEEHKSSYTYDRDNRVTKIAYDKDAGTVEYSYDALGRVTSRKASIGTNSHATTYSYAAGGYGTNSTTPLVSAISQEGANYEYSYDSRGNVISEKRNGVETTYVYDALGQLIRVNDPHENATWVYNYDRGGNITSKVRYAYTTGSLGAALETIPYTYGDSNWKDKLTAYNGKSITYDAIGNPLKDHNGWEYEWQAGRQLARMSRGGEAVSFLYDHNGMRIQKVVERDWYPTITSYTLHGKLISHMAIDYTDFETEQPMQTNLHFFYDANSRPAFVEYNGEKYAYIHNLQGDIVGILDKNGVSVVNYEYDAWGKLLNCTGSMAATLGVDNPFRYRGYVYDEETTTYYLGNRYYTPNMCRFISSDRIIGLAGRICDHNIYMYCRNRPINCLDELGFATVYVNVYLKGIFDYGHVDISIDNLTASYGRYGEVDEETGGLTGEGILVIDNCAKSYKEAQKKGRTTYRFELEMSDDEVERLRTFYTNKMTKTNYLNDRGNSNVKYYKIRNYHIKTSNCTTMAMEALEYAYGKQKFPYRRNLWIPHVVLLLFQSLYNSDGGLVKKCYIKR